MPNSPQILKVTGSEIIKIIKDVANKVIVIDNLPVAI